MTKEINSFNIEDMIKVFGAFDSNLKIIEKAFDTQILSVNDVITIKGENENIKKSESVLYNLLDFAQKGEEIDEVKVKYIINMVDEGKDSVASDLKSKGILVTTRGKLVKPKTYGQKNYVDNISQNTITLGIGPAGTGKTYLAVAKAVEAFKAGDIARIILTRPAVEAGESLGFLPGDLQSKIDPYLRPLYDALFDMLGAENYQKHVEKGNIEVAPLAYMRGRTLDDSFIILDEAQNTTPQQMKMFLTRIGFNSKAIITGDITQVDLPQGKKSGLVEALKVLKNIKGIGIHKFTEKDVVRHPLIQEIVRAYERYEDNKKKYK